MFYQSTSKGFEICHTLQGDRGKLYSLKLVSENPAKGAGDSVSMQQGLAVDMNLREAEDSVESAGRIRQWRSNSCQMSL